MPSELKLSAETKLVAAEGEANLPTFEIRAYSGGELRFPHLKHPVVVDLSGMSVTEKNRPALLDHDTKQRVGHTTRIVNAGTHLDIEGVVSAAGKAAEEVVAAAKNEFPWQASIGVSLTKPLQLLAAGRTATVNGRVVQGPVFIARETLLREISFTALGVDDSTVSRIAAHYLGVSDMKFQQWLEAAGFNADELSEAQVKKLQAQFDAEQARTAELEAAKKELADLKAAADADPPPADEPKDLAAAAVAELKASVAAESKRIAEIRDIAASYDNPKIEVDGEKVDLAAHAIENDWTREQTELKALRAKLDRPAPMAHYHRPNSGEQNTKALEAALLLRHSDNNEELVEKHYGEKVLEAAQSREIRAAANRPLSYLMHEAIRAAGGYVSPGTSGDPLYAAYQEHVLNAAGPSTISIPGILSNVANKSALASFLAVPTTWREIAGTRAVNDFKMITAYRLTASGQFEEVGNDGEIKSGELTESSYVNRIQTYAKRYHFTRQDLINDDLSLLDGIRDLLGRQAALTLEEKVYTAWMSTGDAFWSLANGNLLESTALTPAGLAAAEKVFLDMTDDDGKPIVHGASRILVPTALKYTADRIYGSEYFNETTTANTPSPSANVMRGRFGAVVSPYLSNSNIPGYSDTNWYMLSGELRALQVAFLNGVQTPTIESERAEFHVLGFQFRGYFDFGVARLDEKGAIKITQ